MTTVPRRLAALAILLVVLIGHQGGPVRAVAQADFARTITALSEPGGYFDTDNLISNERSYLSVLPELDRAKVQGGAYVGVGPDQNFSYIAHVRPAIAFIVDIRRDNLLLHLLLKALLAQSGTRIEYLAQLVGRPAPGDIDTWRQAKIGDITAAIDRAPALDPKAVTALRLRMSTEIARFGVALSALDLGTIDRFHRAFIDEGLGLQFTSTGRAPQTFYPTFRDLLVETDGQGRQGSFLASDAAFQFVKSLHARDLILPVVGDLSGSHALAAIGRLLETRGERVSTVYASNVEFYLSRGGTLTRFFDNLRRLPRTNNAVIIRSLFGGGSSISETQPIADLVGAAALGRGK